MIFKRSYELRIVAYYLKLTTNIIIYDNNPLWAFPLNWEGAKIYFSLLFVLVNTIW